MTTEDFIREQFYDVLPDGWVVERITKMPNFDTYDYTIRLYSRYFEHELDVLVNITENGFVQKLAQLSGILKQSTRKICEQFSVAL